MKSNMGRTDKVLRILAAITISIFYLTGSISGITASVLLVLAGVLILTGFMNFCPLYIPLGISTVKRKK